MNERRLPLLTLFCALALFPVSAFGADTDEPAAPFEFKGPTGKVSNVYSGYTQRIQGLPSYQERADVEVQEDFSNGTYGARLLAWAWWRMPEATGGAPQNSKANFELKEGWVERSSPTWDLRVGNQIIAWGAADQINPTDVWNARDLYDPLLSYKLPLAVAKLKIHPQTLENFSLEVIATPFFRESRLPVALPGSTTAIDVTDSRWLLPIPTTVAAGGPGGLVAPLNFAISPPNYPRTWQAGARLSVLRLGGWDFSGSYFNGVESLPRIAVTRQGSANTPNLPITITLNPSFHREEMYGFDGAGSVSLFGHDIGTRFEIAFFDRDNSRAQTAPIEFQHDLIKDNYIQGVFGADYTFPKKLAGTVLYMNAMYVKYQTIGSKEQTPGQTVFTGLPQTNPWDSNGVLYIEDRIGSTFKLTANGVYSFAHGDAYLSPGAQYNWTDNLKTVLAGDIFVGNQAGFFGQFHDNRRYNLTVTYVF